MACLVLVSPALKRFPFFFSKSRLYVPPTPNRTASSAWTSCPARRATRLRPQLMAARALCPMPWANSSSADTRYTCSACWRCTTMAQRYATDNAAVSHCSLARSLTHPPTHPHTRSTIKKAHFPVKTQILEI